MSSHVLTITSEVLLVLSQITIIGTFFMAMFPYRPYRWANSSKKWEWNRLIICLVTKGDNAEVVYLDSPKTSRSDEVKAVHRAMTSMQSVTNLDKRIEKHLLIDADSSEKFASFHAYNAAMTFVPTSYTPKKAIYKARALEYFRQKQRLTSKDWVLHLDEEALLDDHVVKTCIDFIQGRERESQLTAQGIIMYNAHQYWDNWLLTAADIIRVIDDFGHFQFQLNCWGKAEDGFHGSFLLLNGKVENTITWETDSIVEDMDFGMKVCACF
jgi:hypothetical protein